MHIKAARRCLLAGVLLLPAFVVCVVGLVSAQPAAENKNRGDSGQRIAAPALDLNATVCPSDVLDQDLAYSGWTNCDLCHGRSGDRLPEDVLVSTLTESATWRNKDKHELAARVLLPDQNQLAEHMQQMLGKDKYEQLVETKCQACHVAGEPVDDNYLAEQDDKITLRHNFGVTCEACHGPAKGWVQDHWEQRKKWRYETPADKQKTGFVNLRDPVVKAHKCLSCHLGDVKEGKIVTHEMYAAGHPPLAGFDTATFADAMPSHWTPFHQKSDKKYDEYKKLHGGFQVHAPNTRDVLLGGLASLEVNLKLLADYSAQPPAAGDWPEFAMYDCFACHHNLDAQSLQVRSRGGHQAGRPPLRMWPNVVADLALAQTEGGPELTALLSDVNAALAEQPFAERERLQAAAGAASRAVCQEIERLKAQLDRSKLPDNGAAINVERKLVVQVLNRIGELGASRPHDYDSARQLVWVFERVHEDYKRLSPATTNHAAVDSALNELKAPNLKFELTKGKQSIGEPATLGAFLEARSQYKPQEFAKHFARLRDAISKSIRPNGEL